MSRFPLPNRNSLFSRTLGGLIGCLVSVSFSSSFAQDEPREEDFAEVFVGRYFPNETSPLLNARGERRAEALAHFSRGLSYEAAEKKGRAIQEFRKVLEIIPGEVGLARKVAYLLAQQGKRNEGREVLEAAHRAHKNTPQAGIILSEYLATFFRDDEEAQKKAMELAEAMVDEFPSQAAAWEHLVRLHLVGRRMDQARATVMRALEREEDRPGYWLRMGALAQRIWPLNPEVQSPSVLNGIFEKALELGGDQVGIREKVADYFHDSRQADRAREIFEALVKEYPDRLELREKLARVYGALGREDRVIETLEDIVEINPQDAETHRELGQIYAGREEYEKATEHFLDALQLSSGTAEEYAIIGRMILFDANLPDKAVRLLERGAYLHPEDSRLPYLITFALPALERYEDAVRWFETTEELAGQSQPEMLDAVFYYRYGASVERSGDINQASDLFRKSMELLAKLDADDERSRDLRAEVYNYLGYMWLENDMNVDEAGELIKEALSLVPESGAITDSLGWFYFKKGKYEDALRELEKAESMVSEPDSVIYDHLGQTHFHLGNLSEAVDLLTKAVELDPDSEEFRDRLAEYRKAKAEQPEKPATEPEEESDSTSPEEAPEGSVPKAA